MTEQKPNGSLVSIVDRLVDSFGRRGETSPAFNGRPAGESRGLVGQAAEGQAVEVGSIVSFVRKTGPHGTPSPDRPGIDS